MAYTSEALRFLKFNDLLIFSFAHLPNLYYNRQDIGLSFPLEKHNSENIRENIIQFYDVLKVYEI